MNKFVKKLTQSNQNIQKERAENFAQRAELKHKGIVDELKEKKLDIENEISELSDLAPESTTSLTIQDKDPEEWAKEMQRLKEEKLEVEVQLDLANKTTEEWFSDEEE